jgi:Peptidase family M1 domain/Carboxypeptidase regulatory-like domain
MKTQLFFLLLLTLILPLSITAQNTGGLSGTVKDPAGAVIAGAQVILKNDIDAKTQTATTTDNGQFTFNTLEAGSYTVSVRKNGFTTSQQKVAITATLITIEIKLAVAETRAEVNVSAKDTKANNEVNYRALRDAALGESFNVTNLVIKRDVGIITLKSGRVTFTNQVLDRAAIAVFNGEGEFSLTPAIDIEKRHLKGIINQETVNESFKRVVITFNDSTYSDVIRNGQPASGEDAQAKDTLKDFRDRVRDDGFLKENVEANLLGYLYNPRRGQYFNAYFFGSQHKDLRFFLRNLGTSGALPGWHTSEEIMLVNADAFSNDSGIWYSGHLEREYQKGTASSEEESRVIDVENYKIENIIAREKLTATAEITFTSMFDGERVLAFDLLPSLRVTKTNFEGQDIDFVQESRKSDGSFFVITPDPLVKGKQYKLIVEYQGNKVVIDAGRGSFAVLARTSWYPSANAFEDRATFDLTFKYLKQFMLVSVGKLIKEAPDETLKDYTTSHWVSEFPLAVAGFNIAPYKKKEEFDATTKYNIEGYATTELPESMIFAEQQVGGMTPTRLLDKGMIETKNSMRIFSAWFGELPYGRVAITQQPQMNFGQSWPTLIYLPLISFLDSTQRKLLYQRNTASLEGFIEEVTPHEVAHQWWGHIVGWASYHDQWLSEGFADFSASLYLQYNYPLDKYHHFWQTHHDNIVDKTSYGKRYNDVGPIWMGFRLETPKTRGTYRRIAYPKGAYILHMIRWMMFDDRNGGDKKFREMMHDFVKTHYNKVASTEGFQKIVEKHMSANMDLEGNKKMDWFFRQYVYGIDLPSYQFEYSLTEAGGKTIVDGKLTQSGVSDNFKMPVPLYGEVDGKIIRLGDIAITGNSTLPIKTELPANTRKLMISFNYDVLALETKTVKK